MKRIALVLALLFALPLLAPKAASAQTAHKAVLTWVDALNPTGTTYTIYRAQGLCSGSPVFSKLATGVTGLTYTDSTVTVGNYCFQVTATFNSAEGPASNQAPGAILPFAVTTLAVTVQ